MHTELVRTLLSRKITQRSVLVGLCSYLFLILVYLAHIPYLTGNGHQVYEEGQYWRAFTTSLMHSDLSHLGHNALFFTIFSVLLHSYFGSWVFPVLSFLAGGVVNLIAFQIYDPRISLVGISGVIYFMAAFWMTMYVVLERRKKVGQRIIVAAGVSLVLFWSGTVEPQVSALSHALGFGMGVPSALSYFGINREKLRSYEVWVEKNDDVDPELLALAMGHHPGSDAQENRDTDQTA